MKFICCLFLVLLAPLFLIGQEGENNNQTVKVNHLPVSIPEQITQIVESARNELKFFENLQLRKKSKPPATVGAAVKKNFNLIENGQVITENGMKRYMAKFTVPDHDSIKGVNLIFRDFYMPEGELSVLNEDGTIQYRIRDIELRQRGRYFSTPEISGNTINLIYSIPEDQAETATQLIIEWMSYFYKSGSDGSGCLEGCFQNIACAETGNLEKSVVKFRFFNKKGEWKSCSGVMINQDIASNKKPLILTANHCGYSKTMDIAEFYFNYQQPVQICIDNTVCHQTDEEIVTGGTILAKIRCKDIRLIELDYFPTVNHYLAGWNINKKSDFGTDKILGIHHPDGNQKAVSNGTVTSELSNCWEVEWDTESVTEEGCSGSPLFMDSRIIGVLSSGDANCDNPKEKDKYGKLSKSWKKLCKWLDPEEKGNKTLNGSTH